MSNSIWKTPDQKPDIDKQILIINDLGYIIYFGKCAVAPGNKWAYIDDLIAQADKAERLQKGVEALKDFITKLYLNGNITDEQLERYKNTMKRIENARHNNVRK